MVGGTKTVIEVFLMNNNKLSKKGKAALIYAKKMKWLVFPLHTPTTNGCSCQNLTCQNIGKHPRTKNGLNDATTRLDVIEDWWKKWPNSNIGIQTGVSSDLAVLDIDIKNNGYRSLAKLIEENKDLPETIKSSTGSGGMHILFKYSGGIRNLTEFYPGIDVRGEGGYIVAPPSLHFSKKKYEWHSSNRPLEINLVKMPIWLFNKLNESKSLVRRKPDKYWEIILKGVKEGERNTSTASLAGYLLRHGISASVTLELLFLWNERNEPPESLDTIERTFNSILKKELKRLKGIK